MNIIILITPAFPRLNYYQWGHETLWIWNKSNNFLDPILQSMSPPTPAPAPGQRQQLAPVWGCALKPPPLQSLVLVTRLNYNFPQLCIPILVSAATALHCVNTWKNWHHSIMSLEFDGSALWKWGSLRLLILLFSENVEKFTIMIEDCLLDLKCCDY